MKKLGIYVHIPFCIKKCNYCDFLSAPAKVDTIEMYMDRMKREILAYKDTLARQYKVQTIFFGGGTPTLPQASWLVEILQTIRDVFIIEEEAEITLECNPETVDQTKLEIYKNAGFNRISFGLQSTQEKELQILGRVHTYKRFLESYQAARKVGFENINIDLMSALPNQNLESWEKTLREVVSLQPEHISAYSLIIEEGTPFYEMNERGQLLLPDEEEERRMYERTKELLEQYGYQRYEISNYARPGKESRHNLIYWTAQEYLGIGLGATSYVAGERFHNTTDFKEYLSFKEIFEIRREKEILTRENHMEEFMFLGLRKMKGVSKKEFQVRFGCQIEEIYGEILYQLYEKELLVERENHIMLTDHGIDVSNVVLAEFLL